MILEKHFKFELDKGLICTNVADVNAYIKGKIDEMRVYETYTSKAKRIALLKEILDMYDEDIVSPDIDMTAINQIMYHDKMDFISMIQYYDCIFILGTIIFNCFDFEKNALNHTEDGEHGPINLANMFTVAYQEMKCKKAVYSKTGIPVAAYGSTLIFATILEAELKRKFKSLFLNEKVVIVDRVISLGTFTPSSEQVELIKCLKHEADAKPYNSVYGTTVAAKDLFVAAGIALTTDECNLLLNKTTLNQLLRYSLFQSKVEPEFLRMMQMLFGTGKLNLRNDIAHGGFGYKNYYHSSATSVLYFMALMVICDDYIK